MDSTGRKGARKASERGRPSAAQSDGAAITIVRFPSEEARALARVVLPQTRTSRSGEYWMCRTGSTSPIRVLRDPHAQASDPKNVVAEVIEPKGEVLTVAWTDEAIASITLTELTASINRIVALAVVTVRTHERAKTATNPDVARYVAGAVVGALLRGPEACAVVEPVLAAFVRSIAGTTPKAFAKLLVETKEDLAAGRHVPGVGCLRRLLGRKACDALVNAYHLSAWQRRLQRTKKGELRACAANVIDVLDNDDRWSGTIALDEFSQTVVKQHPPPWHRSDTAATTPEVEWGDEDSTRLSAWLSREYDLHVTAMGMIADAVAVVAARRSFHPLRTYLRSLAWDGVSRGETWLIKYCGARDTSYVRAVSAKFLIGAVARVMQPGCKVDSVLILEGKQGKKKSWAIAVLAGDIYYLEYNSELGTKDALLELRGKWLIEFSELDALSRGESTRIKAFISKRVDTYRPPYGRVALLPESDPCA